MPLPNYDEYGIPIGPEGDEQRKAALAAMGQTTNAAGSMILGSVAPDPKLPGLAGYIPFAGAAEGLMGTAGYLGSQVARLANSDPNSLAAKWGIHIPDPPQILSDAGQRFEQNRADIKAGIDKYSGGVLPQPDMSTTAGNVADIYGSALGAGVGFAPGGIVNALPRGLKTVGSVLLPSLEHAGKSVPVATGIGLTQGMADLAVNPVQAAPTQPQQQQAPDPTTVATTTTPPSADTIVQQAVTPAAQPAPDPHSILFGTQPTTPDVHDSLFGTTPAGPTFTQQGSTPTPLWQAGLGIILTLGALAAGKATHSMGAAITDAGRDARFSNPDYAAKVNDYNNDVMSRGAGSGTLVPPGGAPTNAPTPKASPLNSTVTYLADKVGNDVAGAQSYVNLTSADPHLADRLTSQMGNVYDTQLQQNKIRNFLATGYDKTTNTTIPSMQGVLDKYARLSPDQQIALTEGLKAQDEINTRDRNTQLWQQANGPGATPSLEDVAHNLFGHGTDELRQKAAAMQADPQLADIATDYKGITDGLIKVGVHPSYGFFTPSEASDLLKFRPNYVPEMDVNGKPMHAFGPRDTSAYTGQAQIVTNPVFDLAQHVEQLYPQFERNRLNQNLMNHQTDVQRVYPQGAQSLVDIQAPTGAHASYYPQSGMPGVGAGQVRDSIVSVRTASGTKYLRIDDPVLYDIMTNHSLGNAHVQLGALNTARRIFQQTTTGTAGAVLTTRLVPGRTAAAVAMLAPFNAPDRLYAGMADRAVQRTAGVTSGLARGADVIGNLAGVPMSYAMGLADRRIKNFADIFHPEASNPANKMLRAIAGDPVVDAIHQHAENVWQNSDTKQIKDLNISGAGTVGTLDAPGVLTGKKGGPLGMSGAGVRLQSANLSPHAFFDGQWMGAKPYVINLRNAMAEAFTNISDAGHDYVARLNLDNPNIDPESLTYNVRNLYGNPGRKGSSYLAQKGAGYIPWLNVGMQELGSTAKAVTNNVPRTALTMATGMGTLALLQILTHMRSAAHMDFLQNQLSLQQREANVTLALDPDPTKPTMIPLPRSLRMANAFMLDVMSKAVNTIAARHDPDVFNGVWEGIKDFLSGHITTSTAMAIRHAGVDMGDMFNLPPILGHIDYNSIISNGLSNIAGAIHGPTSGRVDRQVPGETPEPLDSKNGEIFRNILANVIGAGAASLYDSGANILRYHAQGNSYWDSMGMGIHDWLQHGHETNPMLFEGPIRLSMQPPIAETVQPTLLALKQLPQIPDVGTAGYTTGGPARLPMPGGGGPPPVSNDMLVRQMLMSAHAYSGRIDQAMAPILALKQQMSGVEKQGMDPVERRNWLNQQTRAMADRYKLVDSLADDMYVTLSKLAGKPITSLGQINWQQDSSQFK